MPDSLVHYCSLRLFKAKEHRLPCGQYAPAQGQLCLSSKCGPCPYRKDQPGQLVMSVNGALLYAGKWLVGLGVSWLAITPETLITLAVLMVIDYATGLLAAWYNHVVDYDRGRQGLIKKLQTLLLLSALYYCETRVPKLGAFGIASLVAGAFCINELISIIENASNSGADIPPGLMSTLQRFKRLQNFDFSRPIIPEPNKDPGSKA